jgi:2-enoate reductase
MDPEVGAQAIAQGRIDALGVARQFLADPEWITKLVRGRIEEIRPCICCHNGCFNFAHYSGHANDQSFEDTRGLARCALNPETMQSEKYKLIPAKKSKRIKIVGGGIGGMEAALVCAKRGHRVTIYEKSNRLGGAFLAASAMSFKEKDRLLLQWYQQEIAKYPITVKLNWLIEEHDSLLADEVIIATGAEAVRPPIKGIERTIPATDFLLGKKVVGDTVIILGGGLTGCEIAYELYLQGKKPIIIEQKQDLIAAPGVCLANSSYLRDFFATNKVAVHLETKINEILSDGVTATDQAGRFLKIRADSVILCAGYTSAPLNLKGRRYHLVGDCSSVGNLRSVIWQAWDVAMKL